MKKCSQCGSKIIAMPVEADGILYCGNFCLDEARGISPSEFERKLRLQFIKIVTFPVKLYVYSVAPIYFATIIYASISGKNNLGEIFLFSTLLSCFGALITFFFADIYFSYKWGAIQAFQFFTIKRYEPIFYYIGTTCLLLLMAFLLFGFYTLAVRLIHMLV